MNTFLTLLAGTPIGAAIWHLLYTKVRPAIARRVLMKLGGLVPADLKAFGQELEGPVDRLLTKMQTRPPAAPPVDLSQYTAAAVPPIVVPAPAASAQTDVSTPAAPVPAPPADPQA